MIRGDLVTDTKKYDTKKSKVGIIVDNNDCYYAVKWIHVPKGYEPYIIESKYGISLTQHFYKDKPLTLFKVKHVLGND
jgi:hypothetical protein